VVYVQTEDTYPKIDTYTVALMDSFGNSWLRDPGSGEDELTITSIMPDVTDARRVFYLNFSSITGEPISTSSSLSYMLRIDSTPPVAPEQVIIHADSFEDANNIADNDTTLFVTWSSSVQQFSGIKGYYYSTVDSGGTNKGTFTLMNQAKIETTQKTGLLYAHIWAVDNVGNIGEAKNASILIDKKEIKFDSYHPSDSVWHTSSLVTMGVRITDGNGVGVDPGTIQYSIQPPRSDSFGPWMSINQEDDLTWLDSSSVAINSRVTFNLNGINYLQWRARDFAGNGYTLSEVVQVFVDDTPPVFIKPEFTSTEPTDLRWVKTNVTISDGDGSGINASSIEYKYTTSGVQNYTDWISANLKADGVSVNAEVTLFYNFGKENYIIWRARDIAGNEYIESSEYQIRVNAPPNIKIASPINNSKHFVEDTIEFDARGTFDSDETDILSYFWVTTYTTALGQQTKEYIGNTDHFQEDLLSGSNLITLYVNDGQYNISKEVFIFVYNRFTDLDKDGLPDWWEEQYYGLDPNDPGDARSDLDGDGVLNIDEYLDDTNPADPEDYEGKEDSKGDEESTTYFLINIIILILVVVFLASFFLIKRARLKKDHTAGASKSRLWCWWYPSHTTST
jgi:hypothetical protein